jgi:hypothetical protein
MLYAEDILEIMSRKRFAEFYGIVPLEDECPFSLYISGHEDAPTEDQILDDICHLFNVKRNTR